ncbi:MAG: type II toxin-antitoxin system RelE/ParE family toxin [Bacteroidales bacterium]
MKVYWTKFALNTLREIFEYYKNNVSVSIANNIKESIFMSVKQLEIYPLSGTIENSLQTMNEGHRYIIRGSYKIIYKIESKRIYITDVFDMRQNPAKIYRNTNSDTTLNEPNNLTYRK